MYVFTAQNLWVLAKPPVLSAWSYCDRVSPAWPITLATIHRTLLTPLKGHTQ